jgi:hypothetical protein
MQLVGRQLVAFFYSAVVPKKCVIFTDVTHTWILYSLFAALRQNRTRKISYGRSFIFALSAQK